ncbi:MAG: glycosyltransferase family 2 protein [Actinomycetales bacterium]|nr:glycosyltransferase family 2 protein [Actinomycetales bacterium]
MPGLVSVVVPVRDGLPHLAETLASIQAQTYAQVEVILSDGGSAAPTRAFLDSLNPDSARPDSARPDSARPAGAHRHLRVVTAPAGAGLADNWNHATAQARGEFIKLVCQDDVLAPDLLARQVAALQDHPAAGIAVARRDIVDAAGRVIVRARGCQGLPGGVVSGQRVLRACYLRATTVIGEPFAVLFREHVLQAALPWRDDPPYVIDLDLYARVLPEVDVAIVPGIAGAFRVSPTSLSTRLAADQRRALQQWQRATAERLRPPPSGWEQCRAAAAAAIQSWRRQMVYRMLQLTRRQP